MAETRDDIARPSQVTAAVGLILLSVLFGFLANLIVPAVAWDGTIVEIRLPDDYLKKYIAGEHGRLSGGVEGEARDSRGELFGAVHGLVFVNGRLFNLDHCDPGYREELVAYQDAYDRGDL